MGRINWEPINLLSILVCNFNNRNRRWESQRSAFHCWIYKRGCRGDWWFPVNSLDSMVQDQSVNIGQILLAAYVTRSINENDLGKLWTASCTIHSSLFRISARRKFRTKRFIQQKVMEAIIDAGGGHIIWMTSGSAKKRECFLWDFQVKFDMKDVCTMGKWMIMFVFVNCPGVKNQPSRFTVDNNFPIYLSSSTVFKTVETNSRDPWTKEPF